jgi:hypothetical protein
MSQIPFITHETNTASYLIIKGYTLLGIQYEPRQNGRKRGYFIFSADDHIKDTAELFEKGGDVSINFTKFENKKSELLDRIKQELP